MRSRIRGLVIVALAGLEGPRSACAGMPSIQLSDLARMRVQAISFFLVGFFVSAWVVQRIWNGLRADFPRMPRLDDRRSMGVVALWGLLFVLVLTMISGARELMTPGAWKKVGYTYKVAEEEPPPVLPREAERRAALDRLRIALWTYARGHDGRFPPVDDRAIPDEAWQVPDASGMRYLYIPGRSADVGHGLLAYEPGLFGLERMVLQADGRIVVMTPAEIERALSGKPEAPP